MSKSNKHHCLPDSIGEQKGELSPFFHIINSDKFKRILKRKGIEPNFGYTLSEHDISTIFHEKERKSILGIAQKEREKRRLKHQALQAAALRLMFCLEQGNPLLHHTLPAEKFSEDCACLTLSFEKLFSEIRLIFHNIKNISSNIDASEYNFLHVKALLLLAEAVDEWQEKEPTSYEALSDYPPELLAADHGALLDIFFATEHAISDGLTKAAYAAKTQSAATYGAALDDLARSLHRIITHLKQYQNEV